MKWKRSSSAATALALSVALTLGACSSENPAPGPEETPTIKVLVVAGGRSLPLADLPWAKSLGEYCHCNIEWEEIDGNTWAQQKQATLATGDLADVTIFGFDAADWGNYQSLFLDLAPELDSMANLKRTFEQNLYVKVASEYEGKILGGPGIPQGLMANESRHLLINKQWLDKLGLAAPTTRSELTEVLEAFKTRDPNGNGQADEIAFDIAPISTDGWNSFDPDVLIGGRGITISGGGGIGMYAKDGVIKNYLTEPAYKEFTAYMADLWSRGVLANDAFTKDWGQYFTRAKGEGSTATVGMTLWWTPSSIFGPEIADQYIAIPQLLVDEGQSEAPTWAFSGDSLNFFLNKISVAAGTSHKDAVLKFVDAFYTPDISIQSAYGSFGVGVEKNGENDYTVTYTADQDITQQVFTNGLGDGAPGWRVQPGTSLTVPASLVEVRGIDAVYDANYANIDLNKDVIYGGVSLSPEESAEYTLNNTGIAQGAMNKWAEWVTKGGVENEWDGYVADLERNNLGRQIELQQAAYDRFLQRLQESGVNLAAELSPDVTTATEHPDGSMTISRSK